MDVPSNTSSPFSVIQEARHVQLSRLLGSLSADLKHSCLSFLAQEHTRFYPQRAKHIPGPFNSRQYRTDTAVLDLDSK
jgi:hypothetical protein